jgi:hypothetical protein
MAPIMLYKTHVYNVLPPFLQQQTASSPKMEQAKRMTQFDLLGMFSNSETTRKTHEMFDPPVDTLKPVTPKIPTPEVQALQRSFNNDRNVWDDYESLYALRLGLDHRMIVAQELHPYINAKADVVSVRNLPRASIDGDFDAIYSIHHQNIVPVICKYWSEESVFVVSEYMPCSLQEISELACLNEMYVAAIIGQVRSFLVVLMDRAEQGR